MKAQAAAPAEQPLTVGIIAYGDTEAQVYADKIAAALPPGSQVRRASIAKLRGFEVPADGVAYNENGVDPVPVLAWLTSRGIKATRIEFIPLPVSIRAAYNGHVIILVSPNKR